MTNESTEDFQDELHKLEGAIEVLFELREQFAQWVEEVQDDSKQEALENVLVHVEAVEMEYKRRRDEMHAHLDED